ncbi:MAG: SUMF1/EgtB/PvdO family nonheme iron enzyme [Candidatus Sumerlaeota bacterium]|nr:SUMF1/EgtB/PvdO family nonheme iron enzyme [Candidatus Sumerlaeota bacterium]
MPDKMLRLIVCAIAVAAIGLLGALSFGAGANKAEARAAAKTAAPAQEVKAEAPKKAGSGGAKDAYLASLQPQVANTQSLKALRMAIEDLAKSFPSAYKNAAAHINALNALEKDLPAFEQSASGSDKTAATNYKARYEELKRNVLIVDNPLLAFDKLLLVKREDDGKKSGRSLGLPQNWQGNSSLDTKLNNEIATLAYKDKSAPIVTLCKPPQPTFVGDVDLHFSAEKMLFSSIGSNGRWQVFEIKMDGSGFRQVTLGVEPDIDSYDPMYLPDGRIIFNSSSTFVGVPCVGGADYVGNLHIMNPDGRSVRRLTFDQDNDWCPTMLPDGRVLYTRWEYTDSAHYFSRVLMRMNPDGTGQSEFYGSNSYWPNSTFYAKPLSGDGSKFIAVISGHHGDARMGELVVFNASKGRKEDAGAIQRIPGYGKKVEAIIKDSLVNPSWPKFLHPYPLSEKYFLVSMKPHPQALWGIYLVDIFDNLTLVREEPGAALLEPIPVCKNPAPPVIPDKVKLNQRIATANIQDIYTGPGLRGVPRGSVKSLRVFQYEYSYRNMGGHYVVGMEGPWDVRRLIGTVPVYEDGSAIFEIPANTPVAIQPLDAEGKALQQMRSWFVGMPGEFISCTGCHESQNTAIVTKMTIASRRAPDKPAPWYGPKRGFSFVRDVQPALDKYCVGCHNGAKDRPNLADTTIIKTSGGISPLPVSYIDLHPYIRRNGPEGDYSLLTPLEFHADTSELVQMLERGHHNVKPDAEFWDRLITWIDLNVPCYGTWGEIHPIPQNFAQRRYEMKKLFCGIDEDIEAIPDMPKKQIAFVQPAPMPAKPAPVTLGSWPLGAAKAMQMQQALGQTDLTLDLGGGEKIALKRIPVGEFVMGDTQGEVDEYPTAKVAIARPFWMAVTEVSLQQYQKFDPAHKNGYYDMHYKDQVKPGYLMDLPNVPVIRVSWHEAMGFCKWLSQKTGKKVTLPTEAQWEWACRAGTNTPFNYGDLNTDFSKSANLADRSLKKLAVRGVDPQPIANPDKFWDFVPKDERFDDGVLHLAEIGQYLPNAWGLKNMHGNVAEWTLSSYRPYPLSVDAGKDDAAAGGKKVVRGGSWYERPKYARSSYRQSYPDWQEVYNVGIRVIVEE